MIDVGLGKTSNVRQFRTRTPRHYNKSKVRRNHRRLLSVEADNGLNAGLNKGFFKKIRIKDVGKFAKKNLNLRNTIQAVSLVASVIPVVGGLASKGIGMLSKLGAVGRLATKAVALANTPMGQLVVSKVKDKIMLTPQETGFANQMLVANETDPNTPNVLTSAQFAAIAPPTAVQAQAPLVQQAPVQNFAPSFQPTQPQADLMPVKLAENKEALPTEYNEPVSAPLPTATNNNTMLYVGGGVLALGLIYVLTKKKQ